MNTATTTPMPPNCSTDFITTTLSRWERAPSAHGGHPTNNTHTTMITTIAELQGNIASAFGLLGGALGVGLIGLKAAEAVGRNPAASGKILVQAIIGMALAEGLGILALFLAK
jgi:F-type H+-transporting ATPase subunit c